MLHKQAVDLFYMSGDSVELVVERGAKNRIEVIGDWLPW